MLLRVPFIQYGRKIVCAISLLVYFSHLAYGQEIVGAGTYWDDSFREWIIYTDREGYEGTLERRWNIGDQWGEWDFRLGDTTASIQLKWPDDPNIWEIHSLGTTVTARTLWSGDFRQWRLNDGEFSITLQSRYSNLLEDWSLRDNRAGEFRIYTYYEGDPRDWVVIDELDENVSFAMRLALAFLAIYHSTPKI